MPGAAVKKGNEQGIRKVFAVIASAMADTLRSLVNKELSVQPGEITLCPVDALLASFSLQTAVVRGAFDKDYAGKILRITISANDATALGGTLMMTPEHVIEERRKKGTLEGEELEAFSEVGNVLCSGIDGALRSVVGQGIGVRLQDHGIVKPGLDLSGMLGEQPLVACACTLKFAAYPPATCYVLVDLESATKWNGKPLEFQDEAVAKPAEEHAPEPAGEKKATTAPAEDLESIPAAPIRAKLSAFLVDNEVVLTVRKSCRRVGLDLDRRSRTDIPNPAAHRDQLVIIEVPAGEERRFEWCKRLKAFHEGIKVVLLLHHPTRQRVLQGFMAKADALLGIPVAESLLSAKLTPIVEVMLKAKEQAPAAPEPQKS